MSGPIFRDAAHPHETEADWKARGGTSAKESTAQGTAHKAETKQDKAEAKAEAKSGAKFSPKPVWREAGHATETEAEWKQRVAQWQQNPKVAPPADETAVNQAERIQSLIDELETTAGEGLSAAQYAALKANLESIVADRLGLRGDAVQAIPGPFYGETETIPPAETQDQRDARMRKDRIAREAAERHSKAVPSR